MISKRVRRDKASSTFTHLGRYILEAKKKDTAVLWTETTDSSLNAKASGKVAWWRITNCAADVPGMAMAEIQAIQEKNKRATADKTYHLIVSFPQGEKPTREQFEDIEDTFCAALGFADHQRLSAVHADTDYWHIHIAISKVHPYTLRCIEPYNDYYVRDGICRQLEEKHGLQHDNRINRSKKPTLSSQSSEMEAHAGEQSLLHWIKETAGEELKACREQGANWQALHATLAHYGLTIRPRGAGLVIAQRGGPLAVKASSVDRTLAMKSLTDRWGAFEPPAEPSQTQTSYAPPGELRQVQADPTAATKPSPTQPEQPPANQPLPARQYHKAPLHSHPSTASLYTDYQRQREAALQARQAARAQLRQAHDQYAKDLKAWYAERRKDIQRNEQLSRQEKRTAYKELAQRRRHDWAQRRQVEADQRKALTEAQPLPTWQAYLQAAAERGDTLALAVLRSRERRQQRLAANLLMAEDAEEARHTVLAHLTPRARKNGTLVYHIEDGGVVADESRQVRVEQVTAGAAFLALALADERYQGQALVVEGTEAFRGQVAQLAALHGLTIRFADPALEQQRQRFTAERAAPPEITPALDAYITQRNALREKIASIDYHHLWTPSDAGDAIYQGRRRLTDGSEAVLLKRGDDMLVKAVTRAQAAKASQWNIGRAVRLDEQGRFISRDRELPLTRSRPRRR